LHGQLQLLLASFHLNYIAQPAEKQNFFRNVSGRTGARGGNFGQPGHLRLFRKWMSFKKLFTLRKQFGGRGWFQLTNGD
jgi:hypothetical protein